MEETVATVMEETAEMGAMVGMEVTAETVTEMAVMEATVVTGAKSEVGQQ